MENEEYDATADLLQNYRHDPNDPDRCRHSRIPIQVKIWMKSRSNPDLKAFMLSQSYRGFLREEVTVDLFVGRLEAGTENRIRSIEQLADYVEDWNEEVKEILTWAGIQEDHLIPFAKQIMRADMRRLMLYKLRSWARVWLSYHNTPYTPLWKFGKPTEWRSDRPIEEA